ncbi:MAG TPA: hypothetical protein VF175_14095 [Lacipirellula sp.]
MKLPSPSLAAVFALPLAALAVAAGCSAVESNAVSVSGEVLYEGQPLSNAALMFYPTEGRPVTAPIVEGAYSVELPPGEYRTTVTLGAELPPGWKEGDPLPPPTRELPPQYSSRLETPLSASVTAAAGESQTIDFTLP